MYRIIIIFFLTLFLQLHMVKSKNTFEFFKKVCKKTKPCDPVFVSDTLNSMRKKIDNLGKRVNTDVLGIGPNDRIPAIGKPSKNEKEMSKMMNWFDKKTNKSSNKSGSLYLNKDGSAKTPEQIRKEKQKLRILQRKTAIRMRKIRRSNRIAERRPKTASERVANRLVNQTINASLKNAAYNELLTEYVDLAAGNIIKDDGELKGKMKKIMKEKYDDEDRANYKRIFNIVGLSGEELDNEIKNKKTAPILNIAKSRARNIAVTMRFSKQQLKSFITVIKKKEVESAKKHHDDA